jgi:hypothetical protein
MKLINKYFDTYIFKFYISVLLHEETNITYEVCRYEVGNIFVTMSTRTLLTQLVRTLFHLLTYGVEPFR